MSWLAPAVSFFWFVTLIGVLVFVHELGHFVVAKAFGVKVLRFSLGFGPRIAGIKSGETEYVIGLIPLGGYVHMLSERPGEATPKADEGRRFEDQALPKRALILLAGPTMNLSLPLLLYFLVFLGDTEMIPPVIGTVLPGHAAEGHLLPGDRVLSIDGTEITTFHEIGEHVEPAAGEPLELVVERDGERVEVTITPMLRTEDRVLDLTRDVGRLGVTPEHPLAVVGVASPASSAGAADIRTFDRVIAAAGRPVERWIDLARLLADNRGSTVPITFLRPRAASGAITSVLLLALYEPHVATLTPEPGDGDALLRAGLEPSDLYVHQVRLASPEHAAGIRRGDRLLALDGEPIRTWDGFVAAVEEAGDVEHELTFRRGDQIIARRLALGHEHGETDYGEAYDRWATGIEHWAPTTLEPPVPNPAPLRYALGAAFSTTWETIELTSVAMLRLVEGRLSVRSIGGPVRIASVTSAAVHEGFLTYLALMAFVSINLGLLNLLPSPRLDGGQILFLAVEGITRRPVPARVQRVASYIGIGFILFLTVLAFKNDIEIDVWPAIVAAFEP